MKIRSILLWLAAAALLAAGMVFHVSDGVKGLISVCFILLLYASVYVNK